MVDKNYYLIKNVLGIRCDQCQEFIWSKYRHDMKYCSCEAHFVDGGFDYLHTSAGKELEETYDILINKETGHTTLLPKE